ncbi:MAG: ABC transporter ATP-binding protein [Nitrospirae bacterium]|nr:ABC transporter ATP-binding protein [Nitrospirota bacterium]
MSHHIIEYDNVCHAYPDGTEALRGVTFTITHGESVGIVGANGSGKTTILLHSNGHLLADSGEVSIGHTPITAKNRREIRKRVGIVFQDPDDQLFMPRVLDDVAFGPLNLGLGGAEAQTRAMNALSRVGAAHLANRHPHNLSGGQKRAVAIASVIAMEPDILIMDEPASNLDPKARRRLIELLNGFEHTKIIASHDLDLILDVCDRCIIIGDGVVRADGPAIDILTSRELLEANNLELPLSMQREAGRRAKGDATMDDMSKLAHRISHWLEHNEEHAGTYSEWAGKAREMGKPELAGVLDEIAAETRKISGLFGKALTLAKVAGHDNSHGH